VAVVNTEWLDFGWLGAGLAILLAGLAGLCATPRAVRWSEGAGDDELDAEYERLCDATQAFDEVFNLLGPPPGWAPAPDDDLLLIAQIVGVCRG
jgi:hypothetical protein